MRAAMHDRYGPPEVVEVREVETPVPSEDRILVRVRVASVNRAHLDALTARWGFTRLFLGVRRPKNPRLGIDVAGVVEAVGPAATRFGVGERVFADLYGYGPGAFAEYVCAREKAFARSPSNLNSGRSAKARHGGTVRFTGSVLSPGFHS